MAKQLKTPSPMGLVRMRRAYFDCRFGQLHVRTAFPTTGGFDEGVTLICLHPEGGSSRTYGRFLPEIAVDRSVYAPDLPGFGESDGVPAGADGVPVHPAAKDSTYAEAAHAVADLAADLRLRSIDLLGCGFGAAAALQLAVLQPALVRRLVLVAVPPLDRLPVVNQESLVMRIKLGRGDDSQWTRGTLPNARFADLADFSSDLFDTSPESLAGTIAAFLRRP